jgi:hypothetical protein
LLDGDAKNPRGDVAAPKKQNLGNKLMSQSAAITASSTGAKSELETSTIRAIS